MINHMIKNFLGISTELDKTLSMLANSIEDSDKAKLLLVVEQLKEKLKNMKGDVVSLRLENENSGLLPDVIEAHKNSIRQEFIKNPQIIYWYEKILNEEFFRGLSAPDLRVAIITEVTQQAKNRWANFIQPELWTDIVVQQGLMGVEETDSEE